MRTKEQEIEFCERCEQEAREDLIYLIDNGKDDAVIRVLDAVKERSQMHNQVLEYAKKELRWIRDELLKQMMDEQNPVGKEYEQNN